MIVWISFLDEWIGETLQCGHDARVDERHGFKKLISIKSVTLQLIMLGCRRDGHATSWKKRKAPAFLVLTKSNLEINKEHSGRSPPPRLSNRPRTGAESFRYLISCHPAQNKSRNNCFFHNNHISFSIFFTTIPDWSVKLYPRSNAYTVLYCLIFSEWDHNLATDEALVVFCSCLFSPLHNVMSRLNVPRLWVIIIHVLAFGTASISWPFVSIKGHII